MFTRQNGTKSHNGRKGFLLSGTALLAGMVLMSSPALAADPANSWNYDVDVLGTSTKDVSTAGVTKITVDAGKDAHFQGDANIYDGQKVYILGDKDRTAVYEDNRFGDKTEIRGYLSSEMALVIKDVDGVLFTKDARIDVNKLIATSGDLNLDDLDANGLFDNDGVFEINNLDGRGAIVNNGQITTGTATENGLVALVAPNVENNGIITAKSGTVSLAAGETVTVDLYGDGLVELAVDGELGDALMHNRGTIAAEGGLVQITAKAAKGTVDRIINNEGVINASSATVQGGKIVLDGGDKGTIQQSGVITTSEGGSVDVSGERFKQELSPATPGTPARDHYGTPYVNTDGGDFNAETSGSFDIEAGYIEANGGDINIDNGAEFRSVSNALRTTDTGNIFVRQNYGFSIQNVIDAINNTGDGFNTILLRHGTYNGAVRIDHANVILQGANAGKHGRAPDRGLETIIVPNSPGVYITADNVTVDGLEIVGGEAGVRVNGADNVNIVNNVIHDQYHPSGDGDGLGGYATGDGVFVFNSTGTTVDSNHIYGVNDDGIHAVNVVDFTATKNVLNMLSDGDQGINVTNASGTTKIGFNTVVRARRDAIQLVNVVGNLNVDRNLVFHAGRSAFSFVDVTADTVMDRNLAAWSSIGLDIVNSANFTVGGEGNTFRQLETAGLVSSSSDILFENNTVFDVDQGILMDNVAAIDFYLNDITSRGASVTALGLTNGDIAFSGNTFTFDGDTAGTVMSRFESGNIDFSDIVEPNTFVNASAVTATAIQLDGPDAPVTTTLPTIPSTPSIPSPTGPTDAFASASVATVASPTGLSVVGDTLGETSFDGFSTAGNFYVRIEDGTLIGTTIDAVDVSFDGTVPSSFPGALMPFSTWQGIESRLYDADDSPVNGRGQIFAGTPIIPAGLTIDDFEDFFREFEGDATPPTSTASLTITRLPFTAPPQQGGAAGLNDINPAAGEGEGNGSQDVAGIEPAAGGEGAQGGENVTCAGDAANAIGGGTSVTYTFGGSFEESIAGATACNSAAI